MKEITLTQGLTALVDDSYYEQLKIRPWYAYKAPRTYYAATMVGRTTVNMHQMLGYVLNSNETLDHIDGNGLNNQRNNLRIATSNQQQGNRRVNKNNSLGFKGVTRQSGGYGYIAKIGLNGKSKYIGIFSTPEQAAKAYDEVAIETFGEFAKTNKQMGLI